MEVRAKGYAPGWRFIPVAALCHYLHLELLRKSVQESNSTLWLWLPARRGVRQHTMTVATIKDAVPYHSVYATPTWWLVPEWALVFKLYFLSNSFSFSLGMPSHGCEGKGI